MNCLEVSAFILSLVSFLLMLWLNWRMELFQKSLHNRTKDTLEFIVNLVINTAPDPKTLRRLIDDYIKNNGWRGGLSRNDDDVYKYHISWEIPTSTVRIHDIEISIINCK